MIRSTDGQFVELISSPEAKGWRRSQVSCQLCGEYVPFPEFANLMDKFPPVPPIRSYFGLTQSSRLPIADADHHVSFDMVAGSWHHVYALSSIFKNRDSDPECRAFRDAYETQWLNYSEDAPLSSSRLYHNINAETLLITADGFLILGKRHKSMIFGGAWSTSIEEQMIRCDPENPSKTDKHLFDAAERGVQEELDATVIKDETRLLKVGI